MEAGEVLCCGLHQVGSFSADEEALTSLGQGCTEEGLWGFHTVMGWGTGDGVQNEGWEEREKVFCSQPQEETERQREPSAQLCLAGPPMSDLQPWSCKNAGEAQGFSLQPWARAVQPLLCCCRGLSILIYVSRTLALQ